MTDTITVKEHWLPIEGECNEVTTPPPKHSSLEAPRLHDGYNYS